ncbi:polysaccharide deacetylase family protein [Sulfobacillus sp. DSM 109850]|uniref:Polysaccharide deacetylase family protein n=1 Tax=Sulfobacillus harzensis TaxID=2729629 RepID=A0A7Y0Q2P8_9FIRM|nr:polysaccharide deacetylase family protein [Sulfobacillus harzensis]
MWFLIAALVVVACWLVFYLLPDLIFHHLQVGAFAGSRSEPRFGLTFDDGPGPDTEQIVEQLKAANVQATFFMISERAGSHPELVRRMAGDGHEIALHMRRHVSAFLLWPWQSFREIGRALDDLEALTGQRPRFFRPPWGHVNLGTWLAIRRYHLIPVFWNIAPDDWRADRRPEWISHYVVQLAQPGTVVVLHDAGGPRQRTADALLPMVSGLRSVGLEPGPVGAMTLDRSFLRRAWTWWELRFTRGWDIETIPNSEGGEPYLRIGRIRYQGHPVMLANGQTLTPGAPFGEIHFGNPALSQFSGRASSGLRALHGVMRALVDLANWIEEHPDFRTVEAVGGVTLLDAAHTIEKLGFQRVPVHGWTKWSMWFYLTILMAVYHKDGWKTLKRFRDLRPVMVLMDRENFLGKYAKPASPRKKQR